MRRAAMKVHQQAGCRDDGLNDGGHILVVEDQFSAPVGMPGGMCIDNCCKVVFRVRVVDMDEALDPERMGIGIYPQRFVPGQDGLFQHEPDSRDRLMVRVAEEFGLTTFPAGAAAPGKLCVPEAKSVPPSIGVVSIFPDRTRQKLAEFLEHQVRQHLPVQDNVSGCIFDAQCIHVSLGRPDHLGRFGRFGRHRLG
jgi:hypothetical protein